MRGSECKRQKENKSGYEQQDESRDYPGERIDLRKSERLEENA